MTYITDKYFLIYLPIAKREKNITNKIVLTI